MAKKSVDIKEAETLVRDLVKFYDSLPYEEGDDGRTAEKFKQRLEADLERARGILDREEEEE